MKKLEKLRIIILLLFPNLTWSQGLLFDHLSSDKTPTPYTFEKNNFLGEDLSKGLIDISIPLYEINCGGIVVPIKITYNSGGIKVDEVSSNVGLGWNLMAGGSVIREIQDLEDHEIEQAWIDGFTSTNTDKYLKTLGYHMRPEDLIGQGNTGSVRTNIAKIDAAPDLFSTYAPGLVSKFYLESLNRGYPNDFENNVSTYTIKFLDGSASLGDVVTRKRLVGLPSNGFLTSKIQGFPYSPNGVIGQFHHGQTPIDYEKFVLTNSQGFEYTFDKPDFTESISSFSSVAQFRTKESFGVDFVDYTQSTILNAFAAGLYRLRANNWNLTKIIEPNTLNSVSFSYESYNKPFMKTFSTNIRHNHIASGNSVNFMCSMDFIPSYYDTHGYHSGYCPECERNVRNPKYYLKTPQNNRINEINWNQGKVKFYYELDRLDEINENALTKMEVLDINGYVIITYFFNYSYFISKENCNEWNCKRLRLDNIEILENTERKVIYTFEYYDDIALPKVNSLEQDFLGYYNNNGVEIGDALESLKSPILYFRPGRGKYSVLPFPINNSNEISGNYSLLANTYSLTGILKKIINPLGGSSEFIYENHDFMLDGEMIKGGGARIKTQILSDGNNRRYLHYEYNDINYPSSGRLNNIPVFGYSQARDQSSDTSKFIAYTKRQNEGNSNVIYSRVIKREVGVGFTEYNFSTNLDKDVEPINNPCTNCFYLNSAFGMENYFEDNSIFRSKLLKENVYDVNQNAMKSTTYNYSPEQFTDLTLNFQNSHDNNYICSDSPNILNPETYNYLTLFYSSHLKSQRNLLTQKTITEYFENGSKITTENFIYDNQFPFIKEHKITDQVSELKTEYFYPTDVEVNSLPFISNLIDLNIIENPIKEISYVNNSLIATKQTNYNSFVFQGINSMISILPISISKSKGNNPLEDDGIVINRDVNGNITEYKSIDNIHHSIIWGYNQSKPIAIIDNMTNTQIESIFNVSSLQELSNNDSTQSINQNSEDNLRESLKVLQNNLPLNTNMTYYTYNPLIGVTSISDSNGETQYYEYDSQNRLKYIKDANGNILKENIYHNNHNNNINQDIDHFIQDIIIDYYSLESGDWNMQLKVYSSFNGSGNYIYKWYYETSNNNYILFNQNNSNPTLISSYNTFISQHPGFSVANTLKCEIIDTITGETIYFIKNNSNNIPNLNNNIQDLNIEYFEIGEGDWILQLNAINSLNVSENYIYKWYFESSNNNFILFSQTNSNPTVISSYNTFISQYPGFSIANKIKCEIIDTITGETSFYIKNL